MNDLPTIDPALGAREGTINFRGYRVWYAVIGEKEELPGKLPMLCLHGGPGACHDYLESLAAMAKFGRRVIFYDQLRCGNSDQPDNPSLWTVPLFVEEVGVVRRALGLTRMHLLGQSWGGMLAMEYALTRPVGMASLTIASSPASMIQWVAEANRLRDSLPTDVQATLQRHEAAGTTASSDYQSAMMVFYRRHYSDLRRRLSIRSEAVIPPIMPKASIGVCDQANLSSLDHRQRSRNEWPEHHWIKSFNDARPLCPS
jgi:proline-specific peptidase